MSSRDRNAAWIEEQDVDEGGVASYYNASRRSVRERPLRFYSS